MLETTVDTFAGGNTGAAADSSARWPSPSCHPGTRISVCNMLTDRLENFTRQSHFILLYGSAGCGTAFFFSRPNKRDNPVTVIPALAYQLATHYPEHKTVIASRLADDPQLLSKAIPVQLRKLIIEPFEYLQQHHNEKVRQPFLVLLDGRDQCKGEAAQREWIRSIAKFMRVKNGLPLLWLICGRPEAHLQHTFARITKSQRIELAIEEECRSGTCAC
ncbi:hypothetical protein NP233_g2214 [Leucocoprinus birnbaumii]|uniref:Nephrocystin 3-like N-terminal domain-containing protein n=1 Tax=Leucocoprinus birnbaumii TaxID=56174 RepID=A0AAD5W4T7_9AGAR|nr:hypothetical protein NP233_g2214 [Leucocoprinus birnbaumii]